MNFKGKSKVMDIMGRIPFFHIKGAMDRFSAEIEEIDRKFCIHVKNGPHTQYFALGDDIFQAMNRAADECISRDWEDHRIAAVHNAISRLGIKEGIYSGINGIKKSKM